MKVFKSNKKSVFVTFLVTVFFCAIFAFTGIFTQNKQDFAAEAKVNGTAIDLGTGGFSGNTTAKNNLPSLYAKLTGSTTATYSALETAFASSGTGTILKNATQINADVKMGGQTWNVVALTKTSSGLVATLWLADSNEKYKWNDWYENNTTYAYPSSMYSSSKIRSRLVGTKYVSTKGATTLAGASVQNTTWSTLITQYGSQIVAPSAVAWQGTEAANGSAASGGVNWTYNNPNDAWGTPRVQNWYSSGSVVIKDITTKSGYNGWSADKLWLPSITETGYNDSYPGLWHTSATQRANSSGTYCWLRSGNSYGARSAYLLNADGSDYGSNGVTDEYAVRPALHLNLKSAASAAGDGGTTAVTVPSAKATSFTYTGSAQTLIQNFNSTYMTATLNGTAFTTLASQTNAGTYKYVFTPQSGYVWNDATGGTGTRTVTVTIAKASQSPTISTTATSVTYGSTLQLSASGGHGTAAWSVSDTTAASISSSGVLTPLKGGVTVTVTYKAEGDDNYNASSNVTKSITLNKKSLTPSAVINSKNYDGTTSGTGTISLATPVTGDSPTATGTFTWTSANAGTSTFNVTGIALSGSWGDKYALSATSLSNVSGTNSIAKISQSPVISAAGGASSVIYGSTLQFSVTGGFGTGTWSVSDTTAATISSSGVLSPRKGGVTIYVYYTASGDTNHNASGQVQSAAITLQKKSITPSAVINSKEYDGTAGGTGTISFADAVSGETPTATGNFSWISHVAGTTNYTVSGIVLDAAWQDKYELSTTSIAEKSDAGKSITTAKLAAPVAVSGVVYSGSSQIVINGFDGAKMSATYSYTPNVAGEVPAVAAGTVTTEWRMTNAGAYEFKYTPKANYCWSDGTSGEITVTVTIAKATPVLGLDIAEGSRTMVYGGTLTLPIKGAAESAVVTWSVSNGSGSATLEGNVLTATHAGRVFVSATTTATNNYEAGTLSDQLIEINKADLTASIKYVNKMTHESTQTLSVDGNLGGGTVTWSLGAGSASATLSATTGAKVDLTADNVGTIKISAIIAETENYNAATLTEVEITVSEFELMTPVAEEAPEGGFVYDGQPKNVIKGYFAGRMDVTVSFNGGAAEATTDVTVTNAGTYVFTFKPTGNYIWEDDKSNEARTVTVTVEKAEAVLDVNIAAGPYFAGNALPSIVGIAPADGMINLTGTATWKNADEKLAKDNVDGYEWVFVSSNPNYKDASGKKIIALSSATLQSITAVFNRDAFVAGGGVIYTSTADIKGAIAKYLTVTAIYDDTSVNHIVGADEDITYTVNGTLTAGECKVAVVYLGKEFEITVPVTAVAPVSLALTFNQGGTAVYSSDELSKLLPMISGVVVTYNDGHTENKTADDLTLSGSLKNVVAAYTEDGVTVENTTITVNVTEIGVSSITAALKAGVTLTDAQTVLDLKKALNVRAEFADGNGRTLDLSEFTIKIDGAAVSDGDKLSEGAHTVEVSYTSGGKTVTDEVEFTVSVKSIKSIKAELRDGAKIYETSTTDEIRAMLNVVVTYTDGTTATAAGFKVSVSDLVAGGECTIIVEYAGLTDIVKANVLDAATGTLDAALKDGEIVYASTTMEELAAKLAVTLDGAPVEGFTVSGDLVAGQNCSVKVTYAGLTKTITVPVSDSVYVVGLEVKYEQGDAVFFEGESVDLLKDVITVYAIYSDANNTRKPVTGYTLAVGNVGGADKLTAGDCTVWVSYQGRFSLISKDIKVNVTEVVLVGLEGEFKQNGNKVYTSDGLEVIADTTRGLTLNLTAVYNNGKKVELALSDLDLTADKLDANDKFTAGARVITAAYTDGGKTVEFKFELDVTEVAITSIEVKLVTETTKANTLTTKDEFLDLITVTATYNDGTKAPLSASLCGSDFVVGKVGEQTVTVNYGVVTGTVKITVEKVKAEIVADGLEYTYDGTKTTQTIDSGAKLVYNGNEISGATLVYSDNTFTNVPASGTIEITVSFAGDDIYDECEKKVTVTVKKAVYDMTGVKFSHDSYSFDYDPAETRSASLLGTLPDGVTCTITYKDASGNVVTDGSNPVTSVKNAGTYTAVATFTGDATNYEAIADITAEIVIAKVTASISVSGINKNWTYDGQSHALGGATVTAGENAVKYTVNGTEYEENEFEIKDAGIYRVTVTVAESDNYYKAEATFTIVVAKAKLEITAQPHTISYGTDPYDTAIEYNSTYKGFELTGESADDLGIELAYTFNYAKYGAVGSYVITVNVAAGDLKNYDVACATGVLTVEQLEREILWQGTEVTFDGAAHMPTASFTDVYGNTVTLNVELADTDEGALTDGKAVNAGRYNAIVTNATANANYKLKNSVNENFVINKAKITMDKSGDKWFDEKELYEDPDKIITLDELNGDGNYKYISIVGGDAKAENVKIGYSSKAYTDETEAGDPKDDITIGSSDMKPVISAAGTYYVNFKIEAENHETFYGQWIIEIVDDSDERIKIVKIIFNKEYPIDYGDAPTTVEGREAFTKKLVDEGYITVEGMNYETFLNAMIVRLAADTENAVDEYTIVKNYTIYFDFKSDKEAEFANYSVFYKRTNAQGDTNFGMLAIRQRKLTVSWGETNFDYDGNVHFPDLTVKGFIEEVGDVNVTLTPDANGVYRCVVKDGENRAITFTASVVGDLKSEGGSTITLSIDNTNYVIENATATVSITVPDDNKIGLSPLTIGIIVGVAALLLLILIIVIVVLKRKAANAVGGTFEDEDGFSDDYYDE